MVYVNFRIMSNAFGPRITSNRPSLGRQNLWDKIVDSPRWAGDAILNADRAYADAIMEHNPPEWVQASGALPLGEVYGHSRGLDTTLVSGDKLVGRPQEGFWPQVGGAAMDTGLLATNVAARYALPAGGVTLAGKGILDIANGLNSELGDSPENGQISLV